MEGMIGAMVAKEKLQIVPARYQPGMRAASYLFFFLAPPSPTLEDPQDKKR